MKVSGYAALFNEWSQIGDFWERVRPGAFTNALRSDKEIFLIHHHDFKTVLATTSNDTLKLQQDSKGLRVEADLADTTAASDLAKLIGRGDIKGMSFSFTVRGTDGETWRERSNGDPERDLLDLNLYEVTITPIPAYPQTSVWLRSSNPMDAKKRMVERLQGLRQQELKRRKVQLHKAELKGRMKALARKAPCTVGFK